MENQQNNYNEINLVVLVKALKIVLCCNAKDKEDK